ncbi:MAG: hypothetical protein RL299_27 [Pseudomonadota bacterium]
MKFLKYTTFTILGLFAAFVGLGLLGAWDGPSGGATIQKQEVCTRMWQDAAPGEEKRLARSMCDNLGVKP